MSRSLRASSPALAAHSMACLPTPPAPRIVTLTGGRAVERNGGQRRSRASKAAASPLRATSRRFWTRRRPSSPVTMSRAMASMPRPLQQLDALRPRGEVEHREQDRAGPEQLVAPLGRPEHDDDVLGVRGGLVDDVDPAATGPGSRRRSSPCRPRTRSRRRRRRPVSASRPISGGRKARRSPGSLYMRGKPIVSRRSSVISCLGRRAPRGRPPGARLERRLANDPPMLPAASRRWRTPARVRRTSLR